MKKLIAFALIIVTLALALVSCATQTPPEATTYSYYTSKISPPVATTATTAATVETVGTAYVISPTETTQGGTTPAEVYVPSGYFNGRTKSVSGRIIDMRSKVLIVEGVTGKHTAAAHYYSKADGEFYVFCFDPFCDHVNWDGKTYTTKCIGKMMADKYGRVTSNGKMYPKYTNSRLYFVFFDEIYSCSEIATDLRIEVSFSKKRLAYEKLAEKQSTSNISVPIQEFKCDGTNLFFARVNEDGTVSQYRYDTVARKLHDLTPLVKAASEQVGAKLYIKDYLDGKIFLDGYTNITSIQDESSGSPLITGDYAGEFVADYDFSSVTLVKTREKAGRFLLQTADGQIYYEGKGKLSKYVLYRFDGTEKVLVDNLDGHIKNFDGIRYFTSDKLYYFSTGNPVKIGTETSITGKTSDIINNSGGKFYEYDIETDTEKCIFDDLTYDNFELIYIDERLNRAVLLVTRFTDLGDRIEKEGSILVTAQIDANGNFIDIEEVELE